MKIRKNGKVINLTESDLRRIVKKVISEGVTATPNVDFYKAADNITVTDGNGQSILDFAKHNSIAIKPNRFDRDEIMTITIPGLKAESADIFSKEGGLKSVNVEDDKIMINVSLFGSESLGKEELYVTGNVDGGSKTITLYMDKSSVKP